MQLNIMKYATNRHFPEVNLNAFSLMNGTHPDSSLLVVLCCWCTASQKACNAYLSQHVAIQDFENFIETKFTKPLHGVSNKGWSPSLSQATKSIFFDCHWKSIEDALVFLWINLNRTDSQLLDIVLFTSPFEIENSWIPHTAGSPWTTSSPQGYTDVTAMITC